MQNENLHQKSTLPLALFFVSEGEYEKLSHDSPSFFFKSALGQGPSALFKKNLGEYWLCFQYSPSDPQIRGEYLTNLVF